MTSSSIDTLSAEAVRNTNDSSSPLLEIKNLTVEFLRGKGWEKVLKNLSLCIEAGETVALVGESGAGKSVAGLSILQLLPHSNARYGEKSSILYRNSKGKRQELTGADHKQIRSIRGNEISMIFQEPMMSLNPLHRIEKQISETLILHQGLTQTAARSRTLDLLDMVEIDNARSRLGAFPHELSGGQKQRVMIAMALANKPSLLIADEPTTALDVTIEAQILTLLARLQQELGMALLLITHDLNVVRSYAERTFVLQKGELVEQAATRDLFRKPGHSYTKKLLETKLISPPEPADEQAAFLLQVRDMKVHFQIKVGIFRRKVDVVRALDGVSFDLRCGETLGIVGESGSGKSTLGFAILNLIASCGTVYFEGQNLSNLTARKMRDLRCHMQIVFQDPFGSLSPRLPVCELIGEGLEVHQPDLGAKARDRLIIETMQDVGLDPETRFRYPHEFSGGQRQRISIARAMILKPRFIVLDEPTSALDKTVQLQVINLLRDLQEKHNLACLFISHDVEVVAAMSHRIMVLGKGKVVECGSADQIVNNPQEPYTISLMKASFAKRDGAKRDGIRRDEEMK